MIQPKIIKITIKSKIKKKSIKDTKIKIRTKPIKLRQENLVFFFKEIQALYDWQNSQTGAT